MTRKEFGGEVEGGTGGGDMLKTCHSHHAVWYTTVIFIFTIIFNADFKQTDNNYYYQPRWRGGGGQDQRQGQHQRQGQDLAK